MTARHLSVLMITLCWSSGLLAEGFLSGSVTGHVVADEEALPNTTIEIVSQDRSQHRSMTTDAQGRFFSTHLAPGTYTIRVPDVGAETREVQFKLAPGNLANIDFDLAPEAENDGIRWHSLVDAVDAESPASTAGLLSLDAFSSQDARHLEVTWEGDGYQPRGL